jgi:hypothetical protein
MGFAPEADYRRDMWWMLLVLLSGCFAWSNDSSAGHFVTDLQPEDNGTIVVRRCAVNRSVTHVIMFLPVPGGGGGSGKGDAIGEGACDASRLTLPAGIIPDDGLENVRPHWCERTVETWLRARNNAAIVEQGERRKQCVVIVDDLRKQADAVVTLSERRAIYKQMPDCAGIALPTQPVVTPAMIAAWDHIPEPCRRYTGASR